MPILRREFLGSPNALAVIPHYLAKIP